MDGHSHPMDCGHAPQDIAYGAVNSAIEKTNKALSTPFTSTALPELVEKAGEVMRQRAISAGSAINPIYGAGAAIDAIRALPNVTLEELL